MRPAATLCPGERNERMTHMSGTGPSQAHAIAQLFGADESPALERILEMILSADEMALLLATPGDISAIVQAAGLPLAEVASALQSLYERGLVGISGYEHGQPVWYLPPLGLVMDGIHFDPRYQQYGAEFYDLWQQVCEAEIIQKAPQGMLRILPVGVALPPPSSPEANRVLDIESAVAIVQRARRIAVQNCPCRVRERHCDAPLEMCLSLDEFADYILYRKIGREISTEEALAILQRAEELGLVHQTVNSDHPDVICNCCTCCCVVLRSGAVHGFPVASSVSRFRPVVDEQRCRNCLRCVEDCHFAAMIERDGQRAFDAENCLGCGLCVRACPEEAIRLVEMQPPEHIQAGPGFNWSHLPPGSHNLE